MSRVAIPALGVGNDFVRPQPKLKAVPAAGSQSATLPAFALLDELSLELQPVNASRQPPFRRVFNFVHRNSLSTFVVLFMLVAASAIQLASVYRSNQLLLTTSSGQIASHPTARPKFGPNLIVNTSDLAASLQTITSQSISLQIGSQTVSLKPETIKNWIRVNSDKSGTAYLHVDQKMIDKALHETAAPYIKTAKNQVSVTDPGGVSRIIASGQNGLKLQNTSSVSQEIAKGLLAAKGFQLSLPTETQAFSASTVTDFDKLIEVNIATKQMYLYEQGQLVKTYPISAGAAATFTPVGQYQIYEKLAVQDMRGYNANGSRYFQPHVRWINYFLPGGYAIHGNYWRPQSWFGAVNSSHGCVSLPDAQAKEVYDWAPIGTTVITHT